MAPWKAESDFGPLNWDFGVIFSLPSTEFIKQPSPILGLQPREKAAMLKVNTIEFFLQNLHENRVKLPEERNDFVLDLQYGRRDVTCKPAMASLLHGISPSTASGKKPLPGLLTDILLSKVFPLFFLGERLVNLLRFSVVDVLSLMSLSSLPLSYSCPFALEDLHKTRKHYKLAVKTL